MRPDTRNSPVNRSVTAAADHFYRALGHRVPRVTASIRIDS
ncbi:hypothetical protein ABIE52_000460 [Rhodococcus sp. OAS809]|jgi:hypothetical protein|nr:hypothetical protein B0E55_05990 [Rhodococcus sp. 66b]